MDNVIGTNDIGAVIGAVPEEWAAYHQQEAAAYDAAMAQQIQEQALLGVIGAIDALGASALPPARQPVKTPARTQASAPSKGLSKMAKAVPSAPRKGGIAKIYTDAKGNKQTAYERGLDNVNGAADFAKKIGAKVVAKGAAYHPGDHKPIAIPAHAGVHGILGIVHDSVLGVTSKVLTPRQHAAVAAHNSAIDRTHAAAMGSVKAGNKAIAAGKAAAITAKKVKPVFDKLKAKAGVHGILGYDWETDPCGLSDLDSHVVIGVDANGLSPGQPGYDPTTDPDAQHAGSGGGDGFVADPTLYDPAHWGFPPLQPPFTDLSGDNPDPNLTPVPDADLYTDLGGSNPDPNLTPIPTGGGKLSQDDAKVVWQTPPPGAVIWDGSSRDRYALGSWSYFYGPQQNKGDRGLGQWGMVWGFDDFRDPFRNTTPRWILRHGWNVTQPSWDEGFADDAAASAASLSNAKNESGVPYGPLIGNPNSPLAGLQYAHATGQWFWQLENAPKAVIAEKIAAIVENNKIRLKADNDAILKARQALIDANAATLAADNAAIAASNADITQKVAALAEAKIKQDAANALAESKATSQATAAATVASEQLNEAQVKLDQQAQQQQLDEQSRASQLEAELARQQQQMDAQQAQFEQQYALAQQQAENQYALLAQQTETQLAPMQQQMDAQVQQAMLQMLMQPPQGGAPQGESQGGDPSQGLDQMLTALLLQQMQGIDQSRVDPWAQPDSTLQGIGEPQFDPSQLPGSFDVAEYYGW